jgi:hypothetical protein
LISGSNFEAKFNAANTKIGAKFAGESGDARRAKTNGRIHGHAVAVWSRQLHDALRPFEYFYLRPMPNGVRIQRPIGRPRAIRMLESEKCGEFFCRKSADGGTAANNGGRE